MVAISQTGSVRDFPAYLHFTPRPDQPERFDEQTAFYESKSDGVSWLIGGNGCTGSEQELWDNDRQEWRRCVDITEPFTTIGIGPDGCPRLQLSSPVYCKGRDSLFTVTFTSGHSIVCTSSHRVLTATGWAEVGTLTPGSQVLSVAQDVFPEGGGTQHDGTNYPQRNWEGQSTAIFHLATSDSHSQDAGESAQQQRGLIQFDPCESSSCERCDQAKRVPASCDRKHCCRVSDSQSDCRTCPDSCGAPPHQEVDTCLCGLPSQDDAQAHSCQLPQGAQDSEQECSRLNQLSGLLSIASDQSQTSREYQPRVSQGYSKQSCLCIQHALQQAALNAVQHTDLRYPDQRNDLSTLSVVQQDGSGLPLLTACESPTGYSQSASPYQPSTRQQATYPQAERDQFESSALLSLSVDTIKSIEFLRIDEFYDITCYPDRNYLTKGGVISHNSGTTTTLLAKVARFVYETPPPRKDTPFWVIAKSYDQVTKTCWKEKLYGQGHILDKDVDWARVGWYKSKQRLPYSVPLKADAKGNNWMLEFRSYEQGIGAMMAQAIGGFAFVEQFPWGVFEEVLRGCREYNFPGSKLVEYTPVDPDLSIDIEEMLENGPEPESGKQPGLRYLPKNWKIYRANTMCAMEAGHVDKKWFEEFFGMVPEDMLDVRMKGLFASFEGVIYKGFNTATHCMGDEMWARIKHCHHRRGIDWGAGPENDFVCLWGARNNIGQWFIYDEIACHDQTKTTVDHLSDVYERWEWPNDDKMYGPSYCDPSSPDNLRIGMKLNLYNPKVENLSMMRGRNSVIEGIEHIQYLLKPQIPVPVVDAKGMPIIDPETGKVKIKLEPKLFIHRTNCPKLVQQMKTYRWLRGTNKNARTALNPRDAAPEPLKKADHCTDALRYLCFSDDFMTGSTISSAKTHSAITTQLSGEYLPDSGRLKGFTTRHRERG